MPTMFQANPRVDQLRARLGHPIVDADAHQIEMIPLFLVGRLARLQDRTSRRHPRSLRAQLLLRLRGRRPLGRRRLRS
ncbi:MAG: hypothetical protein AB7P69_24390 [Candidatus Binatia bacterium]